MMNHNRFLAFLISLTLLICASGSFAEGSEVLSDSDLQKQEMLFEQTLPILQLTVAASMLTYETPFEFDAENEMPSEFAGAILKLSDSYGLKVSDDTSAWLGNNYALTLCNTPFQNNLQQELYTGLFLLELAPSPDGTQFAVTAEIYYAPKPYDQLSDEEWDQFVWADMMALLVLQKEDQAATGWKVSSLHYTSAYFSDDTDEPLYTDSFLLDQYYNEKFACSVSYPSIFPDDRIQSNENGMTCEIPDGSASINIDFHSPEKEEGDTVLANILINHPDATILSTELEDIVCLEYNEGGMTTRWFCMQSQRLMVTVTLSWDPGSHENFADLADRIMESLLSEEDAQG